jgi:hypothetical protein
MAKLAAMRVSATLAAESIFGLSDDALFPVGPACPNALIAETIKINTGITTLDNEFGQAPTHCRGMHDAVT